MKRTILFSLLLALSLTISAQEHMTFKGVEINGSVESVMKQLEAQGFTSDFMLEDAGKMSGTFTGRSVTLLIPTTSVSHTVSAIIVVFHDFDIEGQLFSTYDALKQNLTNKYGEPTVVTEHFESPYSRTTAPKYAFETGQAKFNTVWTVERGEIILTVQQIQKGRVSTVLVYSDSANKDKDSAEVEGDL